MNLKLIVEAEEGGLVSPYCLDIHAQNVSSEDFAYFCGVVSDTLDMDPTYSFPMERGEPINGFEEVDGEIIKAVRTPVVEVNFLGRVDCKAQGRPTLWFGTPKGLDHMQAYTFDAFNYRIVRDHISGEILDPTKPNFLKFHSHVTDGKKVLEELAKNVSIPPKLRDPNIDCTVYMPTLEPTL